ncbi:MAG: CD1247 N-terminal domain-containing protein [Eubacteriales bacterium]
MMTITEKAAYLKGLAEGLSLDAAKPETKLINAIIELLDDLTLTVSDIEDGLEILNEQVDAVDEDLDELESFVYDDLDDEDDEDEDYFEIECPKCGETICVDEGVMMDGSINCPNCDELLEFDVDCDCECGCEDCEEDD